MNTRELYRLLKKHEWCLVSKKEIFHPAENEIEIRAEKVDPVFAEGRFDYYLYIMIDFKDANHDSLHNSYHSFTRVTRIELKRVEQSREIRIEGLQKIQNATEWLWKGISTKEFGQDKEIQLEKVMEEMDEIERNGILVPS